jgi:extradiol dioxygenase family protein
MLLVWLVHSFLKLPKADISENFRFLAGVLGCRRGRIETEQQNDQDEDEWRHAHGRKIARAMMASRTPSNGLVMANQKETFQPWP